jgi:hypothetical protein
MLNVVIQSVIMLNVVAPSCVHLHKMAYDDLVINLKLVVP